MDNLEAVKFNLGSLLSKENFFNVPVYQRPFSWDEENFKDLISDLISAERDQEYFLGTIVLHKKGSKGEFDIVDGQQRLTSIMILLACLRDKIQDGEFKNNLQEKIVQPENKVDGISERTRLEVKDPQIFRSKVMASDGTNDISKDRNLPEPEWRYIHAIKVFKEELIPLSENEAQEFAKFLSQYCIVIRLSTSTFDDAFRLFTIVNDRGKQLRRIDVLKSWNIDPNIVPSESTRNQYARRWEEMEKNIGADIFESIFHHIRFITLKDKPKGDLLREFENRIFKLRNIQKGERFLDLVMEYSEIYLSIFSDCNALDKNDQHYYAYFALINIMDSNFKASEWRPCLMFYYRKFSNQGFYRFCLQLEKVYLTYWVLGTRKDERRDIYANILDSIESAKVHSEINLESQIDEDSIRKHVGNSEIYKAGYCKYFLLRLELVICELNEARKFEAKSTEHVLPQHPASPSDWLPEEDIDKLSEFVNKIGNLVLLSKSKNSQVRNFNLRRKQQEYLRPRVTSYPRSLQILDYDNWDRDVIEQRTKEAQEMILLEPGSGYSRSR